MQFIDGHLYIFKWKKSYFFNDWNQEYNNRIFRWKKEQEPFKGYMVDVNDNNFIISNDFWFKLFKPASKLHKVFY